MKKNKKVRGKSRFFLYYIIILGVVFYGGHKAQTLSKELELFNISEIRVRGNKLIDKEYIASITEPYVGKNIFEIDKTEIEEKLSVFSRIESIKTYRLLPSKLLVSVKERVGVFYIKDSSGEYHPIDKDRVVLDKADYFVDEDLPLINVNIPKDKIGIGEKLEDPRIEYIFEVYEILNKANSDILADISEFFYVRNDLYFIDLKSGSRVILCTTDIPEQINRFVFLRNNQGFDRHSTIDLRFGEQIVVTNS